MEQKPGLAVLHMSHQHNTPISHHHIPCIYLEIPCKPEPSIKKEVQKYGVGTKILIFTDLYLYLIIQGSDRPSWKT